MISLIAAISNNRVLGKNNKLPWYLPADLMHFKNLTMSKPIIMGRKTYTSLGKPLPGRRNLVVSRESGLRLSGCEVFSSIEQAIQASQQESDDVMIIGGATVYQQSLPIVHRMYLTIIHADIEGDTFFPEWDPSQWQEISREQHKSDAKNVYDYEFLVLDRLGDK